MKTKHKAKRCALLTCEGLREGRSAGHSNLSKECLADDDLLVPALKRHGIEAEFVVWDRERDWDRFDCAVIRSTWDYTHQLERFIKALRRIDRSRCRLFNPFEIVRWNARKDYLIELAAKGVSVVPTRKIRRIDREAVNAAIVELDAPGVVIKPLVGAGARNTFFLTKRSPGIPASLIDLTQKSDFLLQPIVPGVCDGEISLCFFGGAFSHGVLKRPKRGDYRSNAEFGATVSRYKPTQTELDFARLVLAQTPGEVLYARVDFVRDRGKPLLMELELIEPLLHFQSAPAAASLFAVCLSRLQQPPAAHSNPGLGS